MRAPRHSHQVFQSTLGSSRQVSVVGYQTAVGVAGSGFVVFCAVLVRTSGAVCERRHLGMISMHGVSAFFVTVISDD